MSNESMSTRALDAGAMLSSDQRKRSQSSLHQGLDLSLMPWSDTYTGRPRSTSSASIDNDHVSSKQHHLSYSGAGRFWKPADGKVQQKRIFSKNQSAHPIAPPQSYDAASSFNQPSLISTSSRSFSPSSGPRSRSEDAESISSELSVGVSSLARDSDLFSRISDPVGSDINNFLREPNEQPLAQRIANDDRRRKTVQHLQRLHELEEDKASQLHALGDFPETVSMDNNARNLSASMENTQLPEALQLSFAVRNSTSDAKAMLLKSRNYADPVSHNTSTSNLADEQPVSPKPELSSQLGPHLAELPSSNYQTPAIVVRPPTQKAKSFHRMIQPQSFNNSVPLELTVSPPLNYVDSGRDMPTDAYETGLHVTDIEQHDQDNEVCSVIGVSKMDSKEALPQVLPSLPGRKYQLAGRDQSNIVQKDVNLETDSLFAGLQHLKQSLPSRNMNPQLPTQRSTSPSLPGGLPAPFQSKISAGFGINLPASSETDDNVRQKGHCELSTSASVVRKHLDARGPVPPSYGELYEPVASNKIEHTKERFDTPGTRQGTGIGVGPEVAIARTTIGDIEPDMDPRTGRPYVGSSGPRPW